MEKETSLSEKIKTGGTGWLDPLDVKECFKKLKEKFKGKMNYYKGKDIWETIDKLAGKELS